MQVFASVHTPYMRPPAELQKDPAALQRWSQTPEVRAGLNKIRSYPLREGSDGAWLTEEVPAGDYVLSVHVIDKPGPDGVSKAAATAEVSVNIPAGDVTQPFDAGDVVLQPAL